MTMRERVFSFVEETYGVTPDYPWRTTPDYAVMRHPLNRKWFAVALNVPREKLGLKGDGEVDILNVKCEPLLQGSFLTRPGFLPGYHMSKGCWLSILLDGTAAFDEICGAIRASHDLTRPTLGKRKNV